MRPMKAVRLAVLLVAAASLDPGFAAGQPVSDPPVSNPPVSKSLVSKSLVSKSSVLKSREIGVGAQYGTSHVYVPAEDMDRFSASFLATFGGSSSSPADVTVTPTPSLASWRALKTPVGLISLFGFKTPVPYPFGQERTGDLVADMDEAMDAARKNGAAILVTPFPDAIGSDAIVQWPGGVNMQFYWHTKAPSSPSLPNVPENRIYLAPEAAANFLRSFVDFAHGKILSDVARAPGVEIGRPSDSYRRVEVESAFGKLRLLVTDGHLPFPYGRETTGYEVADLAATLAKAKASGATVLVEPYTTEQRQAAVVQFPGGYIAEIHSPAK
jgi:hypothetical protein